VLLDRAELHLLSNQDRSARRALRRILRNDPQNAVALHLLGIAQARCSALGDATRLIASALQSRPHEADWHRDLGVVHAAAEDWVKAARSFECCLQLNPTDKYALTLHGEALLRCGQTADAIRVLIRGIELTSQDSRTHELLAGAYAKAGQYDAAVVHHSILVSLQPGKRKAVTALAHAQLAAGEVEACLNTCRQATESGLASIGLHACRLMALLHRESSPQKLRTEFEQWGRMHGRLAVNPATRLNTADQDRQLRIGYLTEDICRGPASHFLIPLFQSHDPADVSAYYYLTHSTDNDSALPCGGKVDNWRDVRGRTASEIAAIVLRDRIDILVDVGWQSHLLHLLVFHCRPAPIQCVIPSFPGTSGSLAVDYILNDELVCPAGAEACYSEKIVRLSSGWLPYEAPAVAPPISPLPCAKTGKLTFGLFQRPAKLTADMWDAVAQIMHRCEDSVLLIHQASRDLDVPGSRAQRRCIEALECRGISQDRLTLRGSLPLGQHLELVSQADIALDTFPYNGVTTTYECLWMGVPVVTLTGNNHAGRMGFSILQKLGLGALAATSVEQYVFIALSLALDRNNLDDLRRGLRERMRQSDLAKPLQTTRGIEQAYRQIWRAWCGTQTAGDKTLTNNSLTVENGKEK
jgi:protein O-GlcNAc transferase